MDIYSITLIVLAISVGLTISGISFIKDSKGFKDEDSLSKKYKRLTAVVGTTSYFIGATLFMGTMMTIIMLITW